MLSYAQAKRDLMILRRQYRDNDNERHLFTTMFDFYALPDDFPCFKKSSHYSDIRERISFIETEFAKDMGFDDFIPYIQLHEFESLLFVDITRLESDYITYWLIPPFKVLSSILLCLFVYPHQISVLCLEKKLVIRFTASILVPITTSA